MALSAARRKKISRSAFVYPPGSKTGGKSGKYPIDTPARARAALSYSAKKSTAGSYSTVAAKVRKRYPGIAVGGKKKSGGKARRKK